MATTKTYTISELNYEIKSAISSKFPNLIWVQGEILGFDKRKHQQHIYFELCEKEEDEDKILAKITCVIFQGDKFYVFDKLASCENAFELQDGLDVRFLVKVDFYAAAGKCQLIIKDIDPTYTLGKLLQNKQRIIEELKQQGLLDKNKKIKFPLVPLKIGLLTSYNSAAYNDFINELEKSNFGFYIELFHIQVQGKEVEKSLCRGISYFEKTKSVEVIVITRGGGSRADLSWFDNKNIAISIANCSLPILTGIGHEIDLSIADMVSNMYFKTPTAVANFLVQKISDYLDKMENNWKDLKEKTQDRIYNEKDILKNISKSISEKTISFLKLKNEFLKSIIIYQRINYILKNLRREIKTKISFFSFKKFSKTIENKRKYLSFKESELIKYENRFLEKEKQKIKNLEDKKNYLDPKMTLKRGFSFVKNVKNKIVKSVKEVEVDEKIDVFLYDGILNSKVVEKKENKV